MRITLIVLAVVFVGVLLAALHKKGVLGKISLPGIPKFKTNWKLFSRWALAALLVWFFWSPIKTKYASLMEWRARDFKSDPSKTATIKKQSASPPCKYYLLGVDTWYAKGDIFDAAYLETGGDIWGKFKIVSSKYGTTSTLEWNGTGGTYHHRHPHDTTYAVTLDTMDPKLKVWTGFIGAGNPGALSCGDSDCWRFRITCDPN